MSVADMNINQNINYLSRNAKLCLLILAVGTPGLLVQDFTGLTKAHDLLNLSNIWRVTVYAAISYYFFIIFLLVSSKTRISFPNIIGLRSIFSMYLLLLLFYPFATSLLSWVSFFEVGYRIFEWLLVLILVIFAFPEISYDKKNGNLPFIKFGKKIILFIFVVILPIAIIRPELAFINSAKFGAFLIHPNKLALICAIGVLFYGIYKESRLDTLAIVLLIIAGYATGSRTGFALVMLSLVFVIVSSGSIKFKILKILSIFTLTFIGGLYLLTDLSHISSLSFLTREGGIDDIINMNNRSFVWQASWELFKDNPVIGGGYLDAPERIHEYANQSWWKPTNAQNDILQALISGGAIVGGMLAYIYIALLIKLRHGLLQRRINLLLFGIILLCFIHGIMEPLLSGFVSPSAVILIITLRYAALVNNKNTSAN